ncbi:MAG: sensor histidine kinase, partial [Frankia sp.]
MNAAPARQRRPGPLRALVSGRTWAAAFYVVTGFPIAVPTFVAVAVLLAVGLSLAPIGGAGLLLLLALLHGAEQTARFERGRLALYLREVVPPADYTGNRSRRYLWRTLGNAARWRAVAYLALLLPSSALGLVFVVAFWSAGLVGTTLPLWVHRLPNGQAEIFGDMSAASHLAPAVAIGLVALLLAPWVTRSSAAVSASLVRSLLGPSRREVLTVRVDELRTTRTKVVDAADAERRRIERDLHDGAQQRLVALAVTLGRARAKLEGDASRPNDATELVASAHEEAKQTLAELRDLVRGIHPAVLSDRGLDAALSALAARCPIPVTVVTEGSAECSPSTEAVAYFFVAETLTNIAKHANATHAYVTAARGKDQLVVTVADNGRGEADPNGAGLRGLADRARALDGNLHVDSPAGGPTTVTVRL